MANTRNAFDSPDTVEMKGKVTGVTKLSKKLKALFALGIVALIGFFAFAIYTMDNANKPSAKAIADAKEQEMKAKPSEISTPDTVTAGVGDGQAMAAAAAGGVNPLNPNAPAAVSPAFNLNANGTPALPNMSSGANGAPTGLTPATGTGGGNGQQVASLKNNGIGGVGGNGQGENGRALSPEELKERADKQKIEDRARDAKQAKMDIDGFGDSGTPVDVANGVADLVKNSPLSALANGAGAPQMQPVMAQQQPLDDQNKQVRKETFLKDQQKALPDVYLKEIRTKPVSQFQINAGWKIPAALECAMNSDLPGMICARVRENVYDSVTGRHLLIPQGTLAIGTYDSQVAVGQERFLVAWQRLVFPDGSNLNLQGMPGADQGGMAGFDADVNNHYGKIFTGAILMSVISAGVQLSQPQQSANNNQAPSAGQTMAGSIGQQLGQVSGSMIQRNMQIQPTLTQKAGYRFNIMVTKDMVLPEAYKW